MKEKKLDTIWIQKISGERERFSLEKLQRSLLRAGVDEKSINSIVLRTVENIKDGMKTSEIYRYAFSLLKKETYPAAIRYSLRRALFELGPSGFPFEKFVSEIFRQNGYDVQTGVILQGACVSHEVDIVAKKDTTHIFIECKFHNEQGVKTDVKVALYVHARFLDLQKAHMILESKNTASENIHDGWIITNTKLTQDAISYAECCGLHLVSWEYPEVGNLQDLILETGVYPITILSKLSANNKKILLEQGVITCSDIKNNIKLFKSLGISDEKIRNIVQESREISEKLNIKK